MFTFPKHRLLAMCDYTGLVWKLRLDGGCFQRWALADGDGNNAKPFKSEWATTHGEHLFVGSNGLEWIQDGKLIHRNNEWVKRITIKGDVANINWGPIYAAMRFRTNTSAPHGYLLHEGLVLSLFFFFFNILSKSNVF